MLACKVTGLGPHFTPSTVTVTLSGVVQRSWTCATLHLLPQVAQSLTLTRQRLQHLPNEATGCIAVAMQGTWRIHFSVQHENDQTCLFN